MSWSVKKRYMYSFLLDKQIYPAVKKNMAAVEALQFKWLKKKDL